jgi:MFS family permease
VKDPSGAARSVPTGDGESGAAQAVRVDAWFFARLFLPLAFGYFLSYLFRTINAVIAPELTAEFGLSASGLGLLTSAYLIAFAGMQIPIGLLLDRFGPRRVQSCLMLVAAAGAFLFGWSSSATALAFARALIGAGVAGCLMASFSAFIVWLPPSRVPGASGLMMAFGGLGAFVAGAPTESFISGGGAWRDLFMALAAAAALTAALIFVVVPEGGTRRTDTVGELLAGLRRIFLDRVFWAVAPLSIMACGSAFALQGLWAGPWLGQVAHLSPAEVGFHLSAMALALLAGSLACGPLVAVAERLGVTLLGAVGAFGLVFITAFAGIVAQLTDLSLLLWAAVGFLTNPLALTYLAVSRRFPTGMAGRVTTAMNTLVLAGSFILQTAIGAILDLWTPIEPGTYPPRAFQASFGVVLACIVAAWGGYMVATRSDWRRNAES